MVAVSHLLVYHLDLLVMTIKTCITVVLWKVSILESRWLRCPDDKPQSPGRKLT
jgi:hypothetical protein